MHIHDRITNAMNEVGIYKGTVKASGKLTKDFAVDTKAGRVTLISTYLAENVEELKDNEKFVVIAGRDKFFSDVAYLVYEVSKSREISSEDTAGAFWKEFTKEEVYSFRAYKVKS